MIHSTLLPALIAMGAAEPLTLPTFPTLEPSTLLVPRAADEDVFSYSYIEVGATQFDVDALDDVTDDSEADTYYGEISLELFKFFNVFLGYENYSVDFDNAESDVWTLGAGVHFSVLPKLDLTGDVAWLLNSLDSDNFDDDSDGIQVRIGARWMMIDAAAVGLELFGRGISINLDDSFYSEDSSTGFDVGLRLHLLKRFSVAAEYAMIEDDTQAGLSARFSF